MSSVYQLRADSDRPRLPSGVEVVVEDTDHLRFDADRTLRCTECNCAITIDPSEPHTEYGHERGGVAGYVDRDRCPHRPERTDPRRGY